MPKLSHFFTHSHSLFSKDFKVLFAAKLLHTTASILTHFFLPVFLFNWGKDNLIFDFLAVSDFQRGMIAVGLYFLLERSLVLLFNNQIGKLIAKIGFRNGMIAGQIMNIFFLAVMQFVAIQPWLLLVAILIESIKIPLFWTSYHSLFANTAVYKNMGKSVGTVEFFSRLLHIALPAISGFVIVTFGFPTLFLIGLSMQLISAMLLLLVQQPSNLNPLSLLNQLNLFKPHQSRSLSLSIAGKYAVEALQFLWPFFVVLLIGSVEQVGFLYSFVFFLSLMVIYFSGWYIDHSKSKSPLMVSGAIMGVLWIGRAMITNVWGIIALDTFDKLLSSIFHPFYDALLYKGAKGGFTLAFFMYRERIICITGVVFWSLFSLYFAFFEAWQPLMVVGFIAMMFALQFRDLNQKALK